MGFCRFAVCTILLLGVRVEALAWPSPSLQFPVPPAGVTPLCHPSLGCFLHRICLILPPRPCHSLRWQSSSPSFLLSNQLKFSHESFLLHSSPLDFPKHSPYLDWLHRLTWNVLFFLFQIVMLGNINRYSASIRNPFLTPLLGRINLSPILLQYVARLLNMCLVALCVCLPVITTPVCHPDASQYKS